MSKQATLGENVQKETFKALALQVPGGHFLIFDIHNISAGARVTIKQKADLIQIGSSN